MSSINVITPLQDDMDEEDVDIVEPSRTIPAAPTTPNLNGKTIAQLEALLDTAIADADEITSLHNEWASAYTDWGVRYMEIFSKMSFIDNAAALTLTDKPGIEYEPFEIFNLNSAQMLIFAGITGVGSVGNEIWNWRKQHVASKLNAPKPTGGAGTGSRPGARPGARPRPNSWPTSGRVQPGGTGGGGAPAGTPGPGKKPPSLGSKLGKGILKWGGRAMPIVSAGVGIAVAYKNNELREDYLKQAIPSYNNWTEVAVTQTISMRDDVKYLPEAGDPVPDPDDAPTDMIGEMRELATALKIFNPDDNQMFYALRDRLDTIAVDASEFLATLDIARRMICKGFMNSQVIDATRLDSTIVQDLRDDSTPEICEALG
ncbi:MAG: hypothetical protein AAGA78_03740 [Pseudomonadota bacterium]